MRMSSDEFIRHVSNHVFDVEAAGFARDLGVHNYQQQKITEFLAKMRVVVRACGLARFVSLFDDGRQQRFVRLLTIPWATVRTAQLRDNVAKPRELIGDL